MAEQLRVINILTNFGEMYDILGDYDEAECCLEEARKIKPQDAEAENDSSFLEKLGWIMAHKDDFNKAKKYWENGLEKAKGIKENTCQLYANLGWLADRRGEFTIADKYVNSGLDIAN